MAKSQPAKVFDFFGERLKNAASREDDDIREGYRLGANAYEVKPVDFENFITAVGQLGIFWTSINETAPDPHT